MKEMERFRHIVTGGYWHDKDGRPTCASPHVRHFFRSNLQLQSHLGWVEPTPLAAGSVMAVPVKARKEISWQQTHAHACNPVSVEDATKPWYEGENIMAESGDRCVPGSWVVIKTAPPTVGQIIQILAGPMSDDGRVVLDVFNISSRRHSFLDMPVLVLRNIGTETVCVYRSKDVLFAFNVQHDCQTLSCAASAVEVVRQERINTTIERQAIEHNATCIYVVNMHALHNEQRKEFLAERADQYHKTQELKRTAAGKKRKEAKEAKAAKEAEASGGIKASQAT
ncbi:hypothetical protein FS749_002060 [Ceratobasidium sp. UAMH 11750]|nr:hypothetical protein FS749_002060 [Ceratobasidium sp. UAMH 11750]